MDLPLLFPESAMIGISVYDLDGGASNDYIEEVQVAPGSPGRGQASTSC